MLPLLLTALVVACVGFAALYAAAKRLDNYGIVDVAWAAGFAPIAWFYGFCGGGSSLRRTLVVIMVTGWSLRLAGHLGRRVRRHHPVEDGRYQRLRQEWAGAFSRKMFLFFQAQAVSLVLLSWPFLAACANPAPQLTILELGAVALWFVAVAGEATADAQLDAFKRDPANAGRVCAVGLWRYSRHPNYFFEWLVWVAYALFALAAPWGWLGLGCPVVMLTLLLKVTGVSLTDEQLERSKGEAFRAYRRRTSAFVPWFPRKDL